MLKKIISLEKIIKSTRFENQKINRKKNKKPE